MGKTKSEIEISKIEIRNEKFDYKFGTVSVTIPRVPDEKFLHQIYILQWTFDESDLDKNIFHCPNIENHFKIVFNIEFSQPHSRLYSNFGVKEPKGTFLWFQTPAEFKFIKIDRVLDTTIREYVQLYNPVVLKVRQEQIMLVHPIQQIGVRMSYFR